MKIAKKIISAICVLGMVATMASAFVVQAATAPTLKIDVTYDDDTKKTGTLAVKLLGMDKTVDERSEDLFVDMIQFGIKLPEDTFDYTLYSTGKGGKFSTNVKMGSRFSSDVTGPVINNNILAATFATVSTDAGKMINSYNGDNIETIEFMTINFSLLKDSVDLNDLLGNVMIEAYHYDANWSARETTYTYGNMKDCTTMTYDLPVIGNSATPTPTATATAEPVVTPEPTPVAPTPTPVVTPEPTPVAPTEGNGAITTEQSGSENDAAVWAWKELTGNGNAVTVTIDTGAVNAAVKSKTFTLGADVEGTAKVGIVIQYDPTVFTSGVSVTSMSLATAN